MSPCPCQGCKSSRRLGQKQFQVSCLLYLHAKKVKGSGIFFLFSLSVKIVNSVTDGWAGVWDGSHQLEASSKAETRWKVKEVSVLPIKRISNLAQIISGLFPWHTSTHLLSLPSGAIPVTRTNLLWVNKVQSLQVAHKRSFCGLQYICMLPWALHQRQDLFNRV